MSEVIQPLLAHDYLTLGLLSADGRGFRIHASTVQGAAGGPEYRAGSEREAATFSSDFHIARDYTPLPDGAVRAVVWDAATRQTVTREFRPPGFIRRAYTDLGIRSELRMPIWLAGERVGFLLLATPEPLRRGGRGAGPPRGRPRGAGHRPRARQPFEPLCSLELLGTFGHWMT